MKALITGITGFVGSHLAEHLLDAGDEVVGFARNASWSFEAEHLAKRIPVCSGDLRDESTILAFLEKHRPDQIYHLVGQASVSQSFADVEGTWGINFDASRVLFDAVLRVVPEAKLLHLSSGSVYGQPSAAELPITEESPLRPPNPYAQSKLTADLLACDRVARHGMRIVVARPFNQIGPRQQPGFAIPDFCSQIATIEQSGEAGTIRVGDLSAVRDLMDVRDAAVAYRALMQRGKPGEVFNVASGASWSMEQILGQLLAMSAAKVEITKDPALGRRREASVVRVDISRLQTQTGWRPTRDLAETLAETLDYWRRWQKNSPTAGKRQRSSEK